jgi:hypothetical protein
MKWIIILIVLLVSIIGGIVWLFIWTGKPTVIKDPGYYIATLVGITRDNSGKSATVEYRIEEEVFRNTIGSSAYQGNTIGEKFKITYEKNDPSKSIVLTYLPFFSKNESTAQVQGKIIRVYQFSWWGTGPRYAFEFQFEADNQEIVKSQDLFPEFNKEDNSIKEGDAILVTYWKKDPNRALVKFDNVEK